jgi:LPXTG-motif cell wall-anchored protein
VTTEGNPVTTTTEASTVTTEGGVETTTTQPSSQITAAVTTTTAGGGTLPFTGNDGLTPLLGGMSIAVGGALWVLARRRAAARA